MDIREIEREVDLYHREHEAFSYSRATTLLNLLRSFEDGCRFIGTAELGLTGSPQIMETNNRFFLDALDTSVKWAYNECKSDDSIDLTSDGRYLIFSFLLLQYAKPYLDICTSFISYSRGYFSASVSNRNITFSVNKPIPAILNADFSLEMEQKYDFDKTSLVNKIGKMRGIREELISSISTDNGHVDYVITPNVWNYTKQVLKLQFDLNRELPGDWIIDKYTLDEYCEVWATLATWMMIHTLSCMFSGLPGAGLADVVVMRSLEEIADFIMSKTGFSQPVIQKIISILVFDWKLKNNDVIYQPIIQLTSTQYALSPHLFLNSNPERNLISIIQKYQNKTEYSVLTNKRESLMAEQIVSGVNHSEWYIKESVNLPSTLPDIDLLLYDPESNSILLCELKWLNSPDSTSEVYARQDDIDKGVRQSEATLQYVKENPKDCLSRAFGNQIVSNIDFSDTIISACVVSKNTIRTSLETIPVINQKQLLDVCIRCKFNLMQIISSVESRSYLSKLPSRYIETDHKIEYAGYNFFIPVIELRDEAHTEKVGRNDACPCGSVNPISGKPLKYKNCCGKCS